MCTFNLSNAISHLSMGLVRMTLLICLGEVVKQSHVMLFILGETCIVVCSRADAIVGGQFRRCYEDGNV